MNCAQQPPEVRRYFVSTPGSFEWAEVVLASTGFFSAVSDYGNYAFAWRSFGGGDFRAFLLGAERDVDYFTKKLQPGGDGPGDVYDGPATVLAIKRHLIEYRRSLQYTRDFAGEEWDRLARFDVSDRRADFDEWYRETQLADAYEFACSKRNPQAKMFVEKILVGKLCPMFRAELAAAVPTGSEDPR